MYPRQLIRWDLAAQPILDVVAETSWMKSSVNWGANSASCSLKSKTNAGGSPGMNPASEDIRKVNIMEEASRTFTCNDSSLIVLEVIADCPKEVVRSLPQFLVIGINTK
jgi:hypothetical protein